MSQCQARTWDCGEVEEQVSITISMADAHVEELINPARISVEETSVAVTCKHASFKRLHSTQSVSVHLRGDLSLLSMNAGMSFFMHHDWYRRQVVKY